MVPRLREERDADAGAAEGEGRAAVAREAEARVQRRHLPAPGRPIIISLCVSLSRLSRPAKLGGADVA